MAGAQRSSARWIALLLGVALVASAAVAYALIEVTAPSPGGEQAVSSTHSTITASMPVSPADASVSTPSVRTAPTPPAAPQTSPPTPTPSILESFASPSIAPDPEASSPPASAPSAATAAPPQSDAVTTQTSTLAGSGVTLPAAWSGTATITVRVLGECATRTPSVYSNTPADLALDLTQNEAVGVAPTATATVPEGQPTLTLGINTKGKPAITVYSSAVDDSGAFHRYWQITLTPASHRTLIEGTMLDQPTAGSGSTFANPNTLADTETQLQPCEDPGTVGLPRVLAAGSTLSGWVGQTSAALTLHATTTDHKRAVTVEIVATRNQ